MKLQTENKSILEQIKELESTILKKAEQYAHRVKINHVNTEELNIEIGILTAEMHTKTRLLCDKYKS